MRAGGGLYVGNTTTDPDDDDIHYDGNLKSVKSATAHDVYGFHPLTTPYTNTTFDGDSFSDVGTNTKIENTSWSTTIPADAKALLIQAVIRDSGSAGTSNLAFKLYGASGAAYASMEVYCSGAPNDSFVAQNGVVPCTDGDIWYQVNASGADTMDVYLRCFGYWI